MVYVIATLILLGILIFVHELGHFLMAKSFGVKVETFSLGFGPKLFRRKVGETEFVLSIIPFGGYVKMFGDEFGQEVPEDKKRFAYLTQPTLKKIMIAFAGPLANVIFTIFIFGFLSFIGQEKLQPALGSIFEGTFAHEVGLRSQDKILSVNGKEVAFGEDISKIIKDTKEDVITFKVERTLFGRSEVFDITTLTEPQYGFNEYGEMITEGSIPGLTYFLHPPKVDVIGQNKFAHEIGLRDGDRITQIGQQKITSLDELLPAFVTQNKVGTSFSLHVLRNNKEKDFEVSQGKLPSDLLSLHSLGLAASELRVTQIKQNSAAEKAGLMKGDVMLSVDHLPMHNFFAFRDGVQSYGERRKAMPILVDRDGKEVLLSIVPELIGEESEAQAWHRKNYPYALGFVPNIYLEPQKTLQKEPNPFMAARIGVVQTWVWTKRFGVGLWKLLVGDLSIKMLSGPIYIGKIAGDWFQEGLRQFLFLMALISLNLGLINLVPIPILDGGHIMFFTIEAVMRRKLSIKVVERAYQVGFALIILLTIFVIYNDIIKVMK